MVFVQRSFLEARMCEEMIATNSIKKHVLRVLSLIACFFLLNATVGVAQNCSAACEALDLGIGLSDAEGCTVIFLAEYESATLDEFETEVLWSWVLDGVAIGTGSTLMLPSDAAQNGAALSLAGTLTPIQPESACSCSLEIDLQVAMIDYNWPCSCHPAGAPSANFEHTTLDLCAGQFAFTNASIGMGLTHAWSFGEDGQLGTSDELNPIVDWEIPGGGISEVPVTLVVTDENGCSATWSESLSVLEAPDPWFTEAAPMCLDSANWPLSYELLNSNVNYFQDNNLTQLTIDWGNGEIQVLTEMEIPFSTTYSSYGDYAISFLAEGANGCASLAQDALFIGHVPSIETEMDAFSSEVCTADVLSFSLVDFEDNDPFTTYLVDYGDGVVESYNHPPPATLQHSYASSSCGESGQGLANAFGMTIFAGNACLVSQSTVAPIEVSKVVPPSLNGPVHLCSGSLAYFEVTGEVVAFDQLDCAGQASSGLWELVALQGQSLPAISAGAGSAFQTAIEEPGLYQIAYEDYPFIQNSVPCAYDANAFLEVCVQDVIEPEWSWESTSTCIPMEVQLTNETLQPPCGDYTYAWTIQGGSYQWANGSGPQDENPILTLLDASNYTVTLSLSAGLNGACSAQSNQAIVSSQAPPQLFLNAALDSVCVGQTWNGQVLINPGNSLLNDFGWTLDGLAVGPTSPAPLSQVILEEGAHLVEVFAANSCGTDAVQQIVFAAPIPTVEFDVPAAQCDGSLVEIIASGGSEYLWSATEEAISDGAQADSSASYLLDGDLIGSVLGTTNYGSFACSSTAIFSIEAFGIPSLEILGDSVVCAGEILQLNATVAASEPYVVQWSGYETTWEGDEFVLAIAPGELGPIEIQAVVTSSNGGCSDTATWIVQVQQLPIVDAGELLQVCNQSLDILLDSGSPTGGWWSGPGVVYPEGVFNPGNLDEGVSSLTYAYTDGLGCANVDTLVVAVSLPSIIDAGPDFAICESQEILSLAGIASPEGGTWSGPGIFGASSDSLNVSDLDDGEFTFVYSFGEGSCLVSDTMELTVLQAPSLWISVAGGAVCTGDYVEFSAIPYGVNGTEYYVEWSANMEVSEVDSSVAFITINTPTQVSATLTDEVGCSVVQTMTILPFPVPNVTMPSPFFECLQDIEVLLPIGSPPNGTWSGAGVVDGVEGVFNPALAGMGATSLTYSVQNTYGCEQVDSVVVEVVGTEFAEAGSDVYVCATQSLLTLEGFSPLGGFWSGPGLLNASTGLIDVTQLELGASTFAYTTGTGSCLNADSCTVHVIGSPLIAIENSTTDGLVCTGDTVVWSVDAWGDSLSSLANYQYNWSGSAAENLDNASQAWWVAMEGEEGTVNVTVTDTLGCQAQLSQAIEVLALPILSLPAGVQECSQFMELFLPEPSPLGGMWSGPGIVDGMEGTFNPGMLEVGFWELEYVYTNDLGCTASATTDIEVIAAVPVNAGEDLAVCASDEVILLDDFSPTLGGLWSGPGVLNAALGYIDLAGLIPSDYALVYAHGMGSCAVEDSLVLTIQELPELSWASTASTCLNSTYDVLLEVSGGLEPYSVDWTTELTELSVEGLSATWSSSETGIAEIQAAITDDHGCSALAAWEIDVIALPVVDAGPDVVLCNQPIPTPLVGFSPEFDENGWGQFYGLGSASDAVTAEGVFDPAVAGLGEFEVVYTFEATTTGCVQSDTLKVTVNPPVLMSAGPDTVVCSNAPLLQFEGFDSSLDLTWTGQSDAANAAWVDQENAIVNPQLLAVGSYTYQASTGAGSCAVSDNRVVLVLSLPNIDLVSEASLCQLSSVVQLDAPVPSGGLWFGTGIVDAGMGTFDASLMPDAYDLGYAYTDPLSGCTDTVTHQVVIHALPTAQFEGAAIACIEANWTFEESSLDASEWTWLVDGAAFDGSEPEIVFSELGWFDVQLEVTSVFGCQDSLDMNVEVIEAPAAQLVPSEWSGCAPLEVAFTNESTAAHATYFWELNATSYSDTIPPVQVFVQEADVAVYDAFLTVENVCGVSMDSVDIEVYPQPQMNFFLLDDTVCSPFTAEWVNASAGNPDELNWDFGNGQVGSGWNPVPPTYLVDDVPVAFDVTLTGSNACGVDAVSAVIWVQPNTTVASFDLSAATGCAPMELAVIDWSVDGVQMTFDFDNGQFSSDSLASTTFDEAGSYAVTQFITNGCSYDTASFVVEVFEAPDFEWVIESTSLCSGEVGSFEIESTNSADVQWSFDAAEFASGPMVSHAWEEAGPHWIQVEVGTNMMTCVQSDSLEITVHPLPELDVSALELDGCAPFLVAFENYSTGAEFWTWDFADATGGSNEVSPNHLFLNEGTQTAYYDVTVTGESLESCVASETLQIGVFPLPEIQFSLDASSACENPAWVQTFNETQGALNFVWSLDGNVGSSMFAPSLEIEGVGAHTIQLDAINGFGCESTMERSFEVFANPIPILTVDPDAGCQPVTLYLDDQSIGAASTTLFIEREGATLYAGSIPEEALLLVEEGMHSIQLEVVSEDGCVQALAAPYFVDVWPSPEVSFISDPYAGTASEPHPLNSDWNFENETEVGSVSYWEFGDGSNSSEWNASHTYDEAGMFPVTLTVYNEFGCFNQMTQIIEVEESLQVFVPNAFTPPSGGYSDGVNDGWRPEVSDRSLIERYDLKVFNRWGQLVWQTQDPQVYWIGAAQTDGNHFAGDNVYTWVLEIESSIALSFAKTWKGHVTLFR